jgi:hypothetical protein
MRLWCVVTACRTVRRLVWLILWLVGPCKGLFGLYDGSEEAVPYRRLTMELSLTMASRIALANSLVRSTTVNQPAHDIIVAFKYDEV